MESIESLTFAQQQRLRFIESMVLWEGVVQRQRVCDVFRVNPNHVTRDIQIYKRQFPKSLEYNPSARAYEPGAKFAPRLASGDPSEYLALLLAYAESQSVAMLPVLGGDRHLVEALPTPTNSVGQYVLRCVIKATRHGKALEVLYNSMSYDQPTRRTLWPHALVHVGFQWHIRAYDGLRNEFRNFAIQRIAEVNVSEQRSAVPSSEDGDWHGKLRVEIMPNPRLNPHQQGIVAKEYGMKKNPDGWVWSENIRRCLVGYFAVHYRLDQAVRDRMSIDGDAHPQGIPVIPKDPDQLKPYLFGATLQCE
ncbi:MAG: WYL domain-containing protein [Proteobacteria bacterium]|nr:WYL domain-containing protein [Pseudomonadota bacterium]